jgi:hypothetical protein
MIRENIPLFVPSELVIFPFPVDLHQTLVVATLAYAVHLLPATVAQDKPGHGYTPRF